MQAAAADRFVQINWSCMYKISAEGIQLVCSSHQSDEKKAWYVCLDTSQHVADLRNLVIRSCFLPSVQ